jgi:hypothetical protein
VRSLCSPKPPPNLRTRRDRPVSRARRPTPSPTGSPTDFADEVKCQIKVTSRFERPCGAAGRGIGGGLRFRLRRAPPSVSTFGDRRLGLCTRAGHPSPFVVSDISGFLLGSASANNGGMISLRASAVCLSLACSCGGTPAGPSDAGSRDSSVPESGRQHDVQAGPDVAPDDAASADACVPRGGQCSPHCCNHEGCILTSMGSVCY